ncbi:hypothetical protein GQ600_25236 [Phytophthora cactorum]|nr:hypothetical protein GQ600_25236 [Phytophthora cactorum]
MASPFSSHWKVELTHFNTGDKLAVGIPPLLVVDLLFRAKNQLTGMAHVVEAVSLYSPGLLGRDATAQGVQVQLAQTSKSHLRH